MDVQYNFAAMSEVAQAIHAGAMRAQSLLAESQANKMQMLSHYTGAQADTAVACMATYEQAATDMIEVANRGHMLYAEGTSSMLASVHAQSAAFPG
jgi:uncharacterized protein YukE